MKFQEYLNNLETNVQDWDLNENLKIATDAFLICKTPFLSQRKLQKTSEIVNP